MQQPRTIGVLGANGVEAAVKSSPVASLILRGALFYGPGTGFDEDWFSRARSDFRAGLVR